MTCRPILLRLIFLFAALAVGPASAAQLMIVLSDSSAPYQEFADAMRQEFRRDGDPDLVVLDADQAASRNLTDASLVIGVGTQASQMLAARELRMPLLLAMLPRAVYERLAGNPPRTDRRLSAVFIDQPPARYIDFVRITLPEADRIGMLIGREGRDTVMRLIQVARDRKLRPHSESIASDAEIYPAMQRLFADGGVLLATPDASVFNAQTIQGILLAAYRLQVPVIGFSASFVNRAGALAALYSTPAQIGKQTADIARNALTGSNLPPAQYPRLFTVGINSYVARAMNLPTQSEAVIRERLERLERLERGL